MSNIDKQTLADDESVKTYYIHPMAFGGTQNPGYGHVPVVHADDFEKLRAKLEAAEKRIAELEARDINIKQQAQALFEAIANPAEHYVPAYARCLREVLNGTSTAKGE
ncbi:hypothetical protein AB9B11_01225 [Enterobacter hormaechei]|uniref:hypothetical protein n=1 Tax=Enterobacter hormaechei TaxID=158836 RepID=UPI00350E8FB3